MALRQGHVQTVDFARGICAAGVFAYHILHYEQIADLDRVSFYAVYAFFVISGFALYLTYKDRLSSAGEIADYAARRFWRIAPLFYTAIVFTVALYPDTPDIWSRLPLNVLLIFGLANPAGMSMVTGGWSIGIEMVFYILLPLTVAFARGRIATLALLAVLGLVVQLAFINDVATADGVNLLLYTQPVGFIGYFLFGCLFAELYTRFPGWKGAPLFFGAAGITLAGLYLVPAETITDTLSGATGAALCVLTIALIGSVAFLPEPTGVLLHVARWFGRMSYPVYLMHPIAYGLVLRHAGDLGSGVRIAITIAVTITVSEAVNRLIERPTLRVSRRKMAAGAVVSEKDRRAKADG